MKICMPTIDDRGKEARLSDHFGSAPCFTFFDTKSRHWTSIANAQAHHSPGECNPTASIRSEAVDVVVCRGLGRRALERLQSTGVAVFTTREMMAGRAIDAFSAGRLNAMTPQEGCAGGHGDCHDH
jgi:predicted Fe-Mo cluster-binding NifX family protein